MRGHLAFLASRENHPLPIVLSVNHLLSVHINVFIFHDVQQAVPTDAVVISFSILVLLVQNQNKTCSMQWSFAKSTPDEHQRKGFMGTGYYSLLYSDRTNALSGLRQHRFFLFPYFTPHLILKTRNRGVVRGWKGWKL